MKTNLLVLAASALALASAGSASAGYKEKTLYDFCSKANCTDGAQPYQRLVMDSSGVLYGSTVTGGKANVGLVFELVPDAGKYKLTILYTFGSADGLASPTGDLILDKDGSLYGVTYGGGAYGLGTVFRLTYGGSKWKLAVLYQFSGADGEGPIAGLAYIGQANGKRWDETSPLFGTTTQGGTYGNGVAYELVRNGSNWTETVIHNFEDSSDPDGLVEDSSGNLWGTTSNGGEYGGGLMYELANDGSWTQTVVYRFCSSQNCADGAYPRGRLYMDSSGNLFGVTSQGGTGAQCPIGPGCGTVFERRSGGTYSVLYNFCSVANCTDGQLPYAGLIMGSGHLFGTTAYGGANCKSESGCGTAFRLTNKNGTWSESVLYNFCSKARCVDGVDPGAAMIMDAAGDLFGMTEGGEQKSNGNAFELKPK
ncbi:MAG TPA: choice-of-anchor tandem repeat GloVer-containing protein [Rhizomicrobium sp.]|jgi:uncharacterized repeat protein (TIGR03803 family)